MEEYTRVIMRIGGNITKAGLDEFRKKARGLFNGCEDEDIEEFLADPARWAGNIVLRGERKYGNAEEMEALCREFDLIYTLSWSAVPGRFEAGGRHWRPCLAAALEFTADNRGSPVTSLTDLKRSARAFGSLEAAAAKFVEDGDRIEDIPRLEIGS